MKNERQPKFLKDFSKENSSEERKETADAIRAKRTAYFDRTKKTQQEKGERTQEIESRVKELETLASRIEELSSSGLKSLWNYFELRKLNADKVRGERSYEELLQEEEDFKRDQISVESHDAAWGGQPVELRNADMLLQNFYKKEREKWKESDAGPENIKKYFTEEHLASLSLTDYELLMRRFPSEMVTHVTQQGVRDHEGHLFSSQRIGEFQNNFKNMLNDGRLRSLLGIYLVREQKEKAIVDLLKLYDITTQEEGKVFLKKYISDPLGQGNYADKNAIHFATQEVADDYYGAERGNEIFFAFPSAYIASQYIFKGDLAKNAEKSYWNDQWVWANEERGIDINVGVTFIPAEAKVDPATGSRYKINEEGVAIINKTRLDQVINFIYTEDFDVWTETVLKEKEWSKERRQAQENFKAFLLEKYNFQDARLREALSDDSFLFDIRWQKGSDTKMGSLSKSDNQTPAKVLKQLKTNGLLYEEAEQTISSQEYWERYFQQHPEVKPSKIVYYHGSDPTKALRQWQPGIKKSKQKDMGFAHHNINNTNDIAATTIGMERFQSLVLKVLEDHFPTDKSKIEPTV